MAWAIFGEVGEVALSFFVPAAALCEILRDSRSAKCCISHTKRISKMGVRSGGCEMTILSSDHARIILESSLFWRKQFRDYSTEILNYIFCGRRNIW